MARRPFADVTFLATAGRAARSESRPSAARGAILARTRRRAPSSSGLPALPEPASAAECAGAAFGFPRLRSALRAASPPPALPPPCAMAGCAARVPPGSEARLSLATFLLGASVLALPLLTRAGLQGRTGLALYVAGLNALLLLLYRPPRYQVRRDGRRGRSTGDGGSGDGGTGDGSTGDGSTGDGGTGDGARGHRGRGIGDGEGPGMGNRRDGQGGPGPGGHRAG